MLDLESNLLFPGGGGIYYMKLEVLGSTKQEDVNGRSHKKWSSIPPNHIFLDVKLCLVVYPPTGKSKFDSSTSNFI